MAKVYILGAGPGSPEYLTEKVKKIVNKADIVMGWKLNLLPVKDLIRGKEVYLQSIDNYAEVAEKVTEETRNSDKIVVVMRNGDPCISSGLAGLLKTFDGFDVEIVLGISSVQLAAAIARVNIDESVVVSFHNGRDLEEKKKFMLYVLKRGRHVIMLTGSTLRPNKAAEYLIDDGVSEDAPVVVCENLTLEDERIFRGTLRDASTKQFSWLSVMVVISSEKDS